MHNIGENLLLLLHLLPPPCRAVRLKVNVRVALNARARAGLACAASFSCGLSLRTFRCNPEGRRCGPDDCVSAFRGHQNWGKSAPARAGRAVRAVDRGVREQQRRAPLQWPALQWVAPPEIRTRPRIAPLEWRWGYGKHRWSRERGRGDRRWARGRYSGGHRFRCGRSDRYCRWTVERGSGFHQLNCARSSLSVFL